VFRRIPTPGRIELVGQDVHRLYRTGLVSAGDMVGTPENPWPLPSLCDLVARKRLTVSQLVGAGVDEASAHQAAGPLAAGDVAGR
jgi:hypothetical protein